MYIQENLLGKKPLPYFITANSSLFYKTACWVWILYFSSMRLKWYIQFSYIEQAKHICRKALIFKTEWRAFVWHISYSSLFSSHSIIISTLYAFHQYDRKFLLFVLDCCKSHICSAQSKCLMWYPNVFCIFFVFSFSPSSASLLIKIKKGPSLMPEWTSLRLTDQRFLLVFSVCLC